MSRRHALDRTSSIASGLAVFVAVLLFAHGARAWENHALATYWALAAMPEVAGAPPVVVEPIEDFLRAEEGPLAALLTDQETWAASHIAVYPPLPVELVFHADPTRDKAALRVAFLHALRVAPDSKLALYLQPVPGTLVDPDKALSIEAVSTLPQTPYGQLQFVRLTAGDMASTLAVIATAAGEPDYGLDIDCWDDSPSVWGKIYNFGPLPFGNPALPFATQAPFHMGFYHENRLLYVAGPFLKRSYPLLRIHQFMGLAALAFRTGHPYWGWRFAGFALHYVQDGTQPYHATLMPGVRIAKMLSAYALGKLGWSGPAHDLLISVSNQHLVLERYEMQKLLAAVPDGSQSPTVAALTNEELDATYPAWSDSYFRDVVTAESSAMASHVADTLRANVPANYISDPAYDFGANGDGVDMLQVMAKQTPDQRKSLDESLLALLAHFGAHSRNALRGILSASRHGPD